jgi:hypothetical protein
MPHLKLLNVRTCFFESPGVGDVHDKVVVTSVKTVFIDCSNFGEEQQRENLVWLLYRYIPGVYTLAVFGSAPTTTKVLECFQALLFKRLSKLRFLIFRVGDVGYVCDRASGPMYQSFLKNC